MRLALIPPVLLLLAGCAAPGPGAGPDPEAATHAFLTSGPMICAQDGAEWTSRFGADGAYGYSFEGEAVAGRWRMDGPSRLCTTDEAMPAEQCYAVAAAPDAIEMTRDNGERFQCRRG